MTIYPFPPLPRDTAHAAEAAFGKRNAYMVIGARANQLLADIDLSGVYPEEVIPGELPYRLCLVTIFQFHEGLTDWQAADATRIRVDWKYALHLPLNYPGLRDKALCDFRQRLLMSEPRKAKFQCVLARLQQAAVFSDSPLNGVTADSVLRAICCLTHLELLSLTMQAAITSLVTTRHEWLRSVIPPHWYPRYSQDRSLFQAPEDLAGQVKLAESIGQDGLYLLRAIGQVDSNGLAGQTEIETLRQVLDRQFEQRDGMCRWRIIDCPAT